MTEPTAVRVRPATAADLPGAAAALADAFADYPWTRWVVPADDHAVRLAELQHLYLGHALAHGVVLVDDDVTGVVALVPPDVPAPDDATWARVAELHGDRVGRLADGGVAPVPDGAWTLATLGVARAGQGRGVGGALLAAALARVDAAAAPVALETSDARNVALYERHGFTTTGHVGVPAGPQVWAMVRAAR
ncbi:GNAT family N-acetyltransferase [Cellulomonas sp. JZ18]|uniref:GNAT family N-acetyltransferase n=1 Tax=Cellulomonas sp. JZ18 TaxID=2654191 RepID=UPI0012D37A03|nr:GNAT family N-acetyltransferase [Cellulomonas sp. JZ18]QGQ17985.1 GNAT family N-acetyltransferase [Cellulomonas sp. JZ18]